jgi:Na+-transporting methylmalonyl-CoA/oxaloacetate decarboxylase gamma subunit
VVLTVPLMVRMVLMVLKVLMVLMVLMARMVRRRQRREAEGTQDQHSQSSDSRLPETVIRHMNERRGHVKRTSGKIRCNRNHSRICETRR